MSSCLEKPIENLKVVSVSHLRIPINHNIDPSDHLHQKHLWNRYSSDKCPSWNTLNLKRKEKHRKLKSGINSPVEGGKGFWNPIYLPGFLVPSQVVGLGISEPTINSIKWILVWPPGNLMGVKSALHMFTEESVGCSPLFSIRWPLFQEVKKLIIQWWLTQLHGGKKHFAYINKDFGCSCWRQHPLAPPPKEKKTNLCLDFTGVIILPTQTLHYYGKISQKSHRFRLTWFASPNLAIKWPLKKDLKTCKQIKKPWCLTSKWTKRRFLPHWF